MNFKLSVLNGKQHTFNSFSQRFLYSSAPQIKCQNILHHNERCFHFYSASRCVKCVASFLLPQSEHGFVYGAICCTAGGVFCVFPMCMKQINMVIQYPEMTCKKNADFDFLFNSIRKIHYVENVIYLINFLSMLNVFQFRFLTLSLTFSTSLGYSFQCPFFGLKCLKHKHFLSLHFCPLFYI